MTPFHTHHDDSRTATTSAVRTCLCALLALALAPVASAQMQSMAPRPLAGQLGAGQLSAGEQPQVTGMTLDRAKAERSAASSEVLPAGEVDAVLYVGGDSATPESSVGSSATDAASPAVPSLAAAVQASTDPQARNLVPLGANGLPLPNHHQLPDLGRLHRQLMQEARIESFLEESDRRHLMAVRAYVERTGRIPDRYIQDYERQFDDSRRTVQQMAKEAMRDYLKQQIGWEAMQDRMKVRAKNLFSFGRRGDDKTDRRASADLNDLDRRDDDARRSGFGEFFSALEVGPQLRLDLDDTEVGLDFDVDTAGASFLERWRLYYGQRLESGEERLRLRYTNDDTKRWFEFTAGANGVDRGEYVAISVTTLF